MFTYVELYHLFQSTSDLINEAKSAKMLPHQLQKMLLGRCLATTDPAVPQGAAVESPCGKSANARCPNKSYSQEINGHNYS